MQLVILHKGERFSTDFAIRISCVDQQIATWFESDCVSSASYIPTLLTTDIGFSPPHKFPVKVTAA